MNPKNTVVVNSEFVIKVELGISEVLVNEQLSGLARTISIVRGRASNFGDGKLRAEVRLMEIKMEELMREQANVYKEINTSRRFPSSDDLANRRLNSIGGS